MENNKTTILSDAKNQQLMKETSDGVRQVSEIPEKENIKPVKNPEIENLKETKTVNSSVAENEQYLTNNFKCSLLKEAYEEIGACLFETRQISHIRPHLIEKHKIDETGTNWPKFIDRVKNDSYYKKKIQLTCGTRSNGAPGEEVQK